MSEVSKNKSIYEFGPFRVSVAEKQLLKDGSEIQLKPKEFDVLLLLIESGGWLVEKQELMNKIWMDTFVTDDALTQVISHIRKSLKDSSKNPLYIQTIPKRGFRFIAEVRTLHPANESTNPLWGKSSTVEPPTPLNAQTIEESKLPLDFAAKDNQSIIAQELKPNKTKDESSDFVSPGRDKRRNERKVFVTAIVFLVLLSVAVGWWVWSSPKIISEELQTEIDSPVDNAEIRQVVRDSQIFESLTLNVHPEKFVHENFPDYWLSGENGGQEILKVKASAKRLREENKRYGDESRLERFDFSYIKIYAPGNRARAGTIERWYLPLYHNGELVRDRNIYFGPYPIDYILQKVNGRWLIERTTTPRAEQK